MKKERAVYFIRRYLDDYDFKTYTSALLASLADFLFIFYNAITGFTERSAWHNSIWFYYLLLCLIRALLLHARKSEKHTAFCITVTGFLMIILNLSLSFPIYALINGIRTFDRALIEAIIIAAYTTVKVTLAIRHVLKAIRTEDTIIKRLRALTLMDALFSILILQNTLIMTIDGKIEGRMLTLSVFTSSLFSLSIILISIASFFDGKKALFKN